MNQDYAAYLAGFNAGKNGLVLVEGDSRDYIQGHADGIVAAGLIAKERLYPCPSCGSDMGIIRFCEWCDRRINGSRGTPRYNK